MASPASRSMSPLISLKTLAASYRHRRTSSVSSMFSFTSITSTTTSSSTSSGGSAVSEKASDLDYIEYDPERLGTPRFKVKDDKKKLVWSLPDQNGYRWLSVVTTGDD